MKRSNSSFVWRLAWVAALVLLLAGGMLGAEGQKEQEVLNFALSGTPIRTKLQAPLPFRP